MTHGTASSREDTSIPFDPLPSMYQSARAMQRSFRYTAVLFSRRCLFVNRSSASALWPFGSSLNCLTLAYGRTR